MAEPQKKSKRTFHHEGREEHGAAYAIIKVEKAISHEDREEHEVREYKKNKFLRALRGDMIFTHWFSNLKSAQNLRKARTLSISIA